MVNGSRSDGITNHKKKSEPESHQARFFGEEGEPLRIALWHEKHDNPAAEVFAASSGLRSAVNRFGFAFGVTAAAMSFVRRDFAVRAAIVFAQ